MMYAQKSAVAVKWSVMKSTGAVDHCVCLNSSITSLCFRLIWLKAASFIGWLHTCKPMSKLREVWKVLLTLVSRLRHPLSSSLCLVTFVDFSSVHVKCVLRRENSGQATSELSFAAITTENRELDCVWHAPYKNKFVLPINTKVTLNLLIEGANCMHK